MKEPKKRIRHAVPLRHIADKVKRSACHVGRILNKRGEYSKETEKNVYAAIEECMREAKSAQKKRR